MKIKCTTSNTACIEVGKEYEIKPGEDGFSPTIDHDMGGLYYLNGKDNLSVMVVNKVIAEFEVVE